METFSPMNRTIISLIASFVFFLTACQVNTPQSSEAAIEQGSSAIETQPEVTSPPAVEAVEGGESTSTNNESGATDTAAESELHPAERLIANFTGLSQTAGDLLVLYGQVLDVNEAPVPDAVVEIWQTDATGVYDHPRDPGTGTRDTSFQFFGTAITDADGWYAFRTITPGRYEPRPRHIHFKVKEGAKTLLTSQFYFSDDVADLEDEQMFQAVGNSGDLLLIQLVQGDGQLLANARIVVDRGVGSGPLALTPTQTEGPYYPVVSLAGYDNDLVVLP